MAARTGLFHKRVSGALVASCLVASILLAACIGDDSTSSSAEEASSSPAEGAYADAVRLLQVGTTQAFTVEYRAESRGREFHMVHARDSRREAQVFKLNGPVLSGAINNGDYLYICGREDEDAPGTCSRYEARAHGLPQEDWLWPTEGIGAFLLPDRKNADALVSRPGRTIAGRAASCFGGGPDPDFVAFCLDRERGLLLYSFEDEGDLVLEATHVSTKVDTKLFVPPFPVEDGTDPHYLGD